MAEAMQKPSLGRRGSWDPWGLGMGDTCLSTHLDELVVTLITKLLQHTLCLDQPLLCTPSLLQLHIQGGNKATGVTLHPLQAAGLLLVHQAVQLLELMPDHPAEDIGLILGQGEPVMARATAEPRGDD